MWNIFYDEREMIKEENERMRLAERLIQEDMFFYNGKLVPDNRPFDIYDTKYQNAKDGVFDWYLIVRKEEGAIICTFFLCFNIIICAF